METKEQPLIVSESKITTVKQKDPKRVEMGKRLAAMSKAAREKKKQLAEADAAPQKEHESWDINYDRLIGLAGIIIAAVSICYSCAAPKKDAPVVMRNASSVVKVEPNGKGDFIEL